ncbi:hypothetical protein KUV57_12890 [Epibacterium sp. DP7N7-1]|nr:hypothetical protein [Epibacterium sp. DP7N7-1]
MGYHERGNMMSWRLEKDLSELMQFSAMVFVIIRAECPNYGGGDADYASRLRTIEAYADAAHNLNLMVEALLTAGQSGAAERIAEEAECQLRVFRMIKESLPAEASYARWTWQSGIDLLERIRRDCFTPIDGAPIEGLPGKALD